MVAVGEVLVPPDTDKPKDSGGATFGADGLLTPEATPEADANRNAADQERRDKEGEPKGPAISDGESEESETGSESEEELPKLSEEEEKEVKRGWIKIMTRLSDSRRMQMESITRRIFRLVI